MKKISIYLVLFLMILGIGIADSDLVKRDQLKVPSAYKRVRESKELGGFSVTFLGNSTFYVTDGKTNIMVDGFLSRIRKTKTMFGRLETDRRLISKLFCELGIERLNAIAVGHSHHDHALDAPFLAKRYGATILSNRSYERIHEGAFPNFPEEKLVTFGPEGGWRTFGDFKVQMIPSLHAKSKKLVHKLVKGDISKTVDPPARFGKFNCGDVFAILITHPSGSFVVTTTAGARPGALDHFKGEVDVFFLAIGLMGKLKQDEMDTYFNETVKAVAPRLVVPVHWDDFTKPVTNTLTPIPKLIDNLPRAIQHIETESEGKFEVGVMEFKESIYFPVKKR